MGNEHRLSALVGICALAALASGCGGGGGLSTGGTDFSHDFGNGFSARGRGAAVFSIPSTGTAVFNSTAGGDITSVSFTPRTGLYRNAKIAFASIRTGNDDVFVMDSDGSNVRQLTTNTASDRNPSISADGSKVFFESTRIGTPQIFVINSDGTGEKRLTGNSFSDYGAEVSPDGNYVVFASNRDGNAEIYIMDSDGTDQRRLTNISAIDDSPVISPDGSRIVFISDRGSVRRVWTMNIDGSGAAQVTGGSFGNEYDPRWSPDGSKIVYVNTSGGINTINANGTGASQIVSGPGKSSPAYSPDGQKVIYSGDAGGGNREIFVASADGSGSPARLTYESANDNQPSLSGSQLTTRVLVGAPGSDRGKDPPLGTSVGGFLASLNGDVIGDVISFDAATRANLYVDSLYLGTSAGLVGAMVSGDTITSMLQDNGRDIAPTKIIGSGGLYAPSVATVELFFDPNTGRLVSVVPIGRGRAKGTAGGDVLENGRYIVRGDVLAAIDMTTKRNMAPKGASQVSIDPATGQIMAVK